MPENDKPTIERLLSLYDLKPRDARPAGGTAGATWRVATDAGDVFVRRRGSRTSTPERAAYDHGLRRYLAENGFHATPPTPTRYGRTCVAMVDGVYEVYPWVEGLPISDALAPLARVPVAETLAWFHEVANGYEAPCEPFVPQFAHFDVPIASRARFDDPAAFLDVIEHMLSAYGTPANRDALLRARDLTLRLREMFDPDLYDALPRCVIHGDYNRYNLLFAADGAVVGVFDYDWAWRDARARDVAELVLFYGTTRKQATETGSIWSLTAAPRFKRAPMREAVRAYAARAPLTGAERRAVPLAMLARWVSMRTEGIMKVPPERRAEFLLLDFEAPFAWYDAEADTFARQMGE